MKVKARREEGFTLIELLVVMVILAALAAIAIPALTSQRQRAYNSVMAGDLKAMVTAETAWLVENDVYTDVLPNLTEFGYHGSQQVTGHVKLVGAEYLACTKHDSSAYWLVFDSSTALTAKSPADCL
jgi:prepilin-type N-terminal cleavage/methylation domain-containing protein